MISNSSGWCPPIFNRLIRDKESERTVRDQTFEYTAMDIARWTAMDSAINVEDTKLCTSEMMGSCTAKSPEKIPPMPQPPEFASQAASTFTVSTPDWDGGGGQTARGMFWWVEVARGISTTLSTCAHAHSLASLIFFSIISCALNTLFSKMNTFLTFHKFHKTQSHMGAVTPTGGSGMKLLPCLIIRKETR